MGYYLKTKSGMKGPISVDQIRNLYAEAKLRDEHVVQDAEGSKFTVSNVLGLDILDDDNFAVDDFDAAPAQDEYAVEESSPPVAQSAPAPSRKRARPAPRKGAARKSAGGLKSKAGGKRQTSSRGRASSRGRIPKAGAIGSFERNPRSKLGWAIVCFHISAAIYGLGGLAIIAIAILAGGAGSSELDPTGTTIMSVILGVSGVLCIGLAFAAELLVKHLKLRSSTARTIGIVLGVLLLFGIGFILGILILISLTDKETTSEFS